jgi:hypothetical protein
VALDAAWARPPVSEGPLVVAGTFEVEAPGFVALTRRADT